MSSLSPSLINTKLAILGLTDDAPTRTKKYAALIKIAKLDDLVAIKEIEYNVDNCTEDWRLNCHPLWRFPVLQIITTADDTNTNNNNNNNRQQRFIFESMSIFRHLLRVSAEKEKELFLYGKNEVEASKIDMWIDFCNNEIDIHGAKILYAELGWSTYQQFLKEKDELFDKMMSALNGLNIWLETREYLVADRLTGADIVMATSLEIFLSSLSRSKEIWDKFENVTKYYFRVFESNPGFAESQFFFKDGKGKPISKPE